MTDLIATFQSREEEFVPESFDHADDWCLRSQTTRIAQEAEAAPSGLTLPGAHAPTVSGARAHRAEGQGE